MLHRRRSAPASSVPALIGALIIALTAAIGVSSIPGGVSIPLLLVLAVSLTPWRGGTAR